MSELFQLAQPEVINAPNMKIDKSVLIYERNDSGVDFSFFVIVITTLILCILFGLL